MHIAGIEYSLRVFKRIPNIGDIDSKLVGIDDLIQTNNFTKLSVIMSPSYLVQNSKAVQQRLSTPLPAVIPAIVLRGNKCALPKY